MAVAISATRSAFWSRFIQSPAPGLPRIACRRSGGTRVGSGYSGLRLRGVSGDVTGASRVDSDARTHRGGQRDRAEVATLRGGRPGADDLVDHRGVVLEESLLGEIRLAQRQV